jgi:hypothetical protein
MRRALFTLLVTLMPHAGSAHAVAPATVDPDAARHTMVRAAGMPLNDSGLPPGMLTVRVVRGAFTADLPDVVVTASIAGGRTEAARTGADGRAQFAHLPVGAHVHISATVGDQQLTSEAFALPAESGVRVLLVADDGGAATGSESAADASFTPAVPVPQSGSSRTESVAPARRGVSRGVLAIRIFLTVATLAAFAVVLFRQSAPRQRRTGPT